MTVLTDRNTGMDRMVSTSRGMDAFQQQMNGLVGILLRLIDDQGSIILHVTAANAGEGTTTIARGLAAAASRSPWCKVALLDAGRRDDATLPGETLTDVLQAFDATKKLPLVRQNVGDTSIGAGLLGLSGPAAPNLELIRSVYGTLRANYTLTVVDCPPVNLSQATVAYSRLADGVLLVVSAERTRVADIERAQSNLVQFGATVLGTVMNHGRRRVPRFLDRFL
jgi:Mrp family chromosome partitioning ATPase